MSTSESHLLETDLREPTASLQKPLFTDSIVNIDLVCDNIFSRASARSLVCVAATCRGARTAVESYMQYTFNINKLLRRFFSDPTAFRSMQAQTCTLISGSVALQFFGRFSYPDSDLDLYTPPWARGEVGRWLIREGYQFQPVALVQPPSFEETAVIPVPRYPEELHYSLPGIACVYTFKKIAADSKELIVQVVVSVRSPLEAILGFHSTCVMNVVSFERAYCFFPRATLEENRTLVSSSHMGRNRRRTQGLAKYRGRGWKIDQIIPQHLKVGPHPLYPLGHRWADDEYSWVIPLDTTGIQLPSPPNPFSVPLTYDPVHVSNWFVYHTNRYGATMFSEVIEKAVLRHLYVITEKGISEHLMAYLVQKDYEERLKIHENLEGLTHCDVEFAEVCRQYRALRLPMIEYIPRLSRNSIRRRI